MLKNFFLVTLRNFWRNKAFSTINILGLAIGMAAALLIGLWVENELSYDSFYDKAPRIYELYSRQAYNGKPDAWPRVTTLMAPELKKTYAGVEDAVRFRTVYFLMTQGEKHINIEGAFADSGFLSMFNLPLLEGEPGTALNSSQGIVLTEHVAKNLFGNKDALGKIVRIDSVDNFKVTGVLRDLPGNTEFTFQYLLPWSYVTRLGWDINSSWGNTTTSTYALLKPGVSQTAFDNKIRDIVRRHIRVGQDASRETFTQPITRAHLYSRVENGRLTDGLIRMVRLFAVIAVFILLIACINFMNLSTARSERRAREVGIRKVAGALRRSLIAQFIGESILLVFFSFLLSLVLVYFALKPFNHLITAQLQLQLDDGYFWLFALVFVLFTGLIAGSYPAFYLSSFRPVSVLKGTFRKVNALITPRKVLVVMQFTFAIVLIICTIIVERQIRYARERETGYEQDRLVYTFVQGDVLPHYDAIKKDLISSGAATAVTKLFSPITRSWGNVTGLSWPGSTDADKDRSFVQFESDADFVRTTGTKLIAGRDIDLKTYATDSTALLLNEAAVKAMRLKDPLGAVIRNAQGVDCHVVGVIRDFIMGSPYDVIQPMVIQGLSTGYPVVHFRLNPAYTIADDLARAEKVFQRYNPQYPFEANFVDESYNAKFRAQQQQGTLGLLFAGLAIFISCLGLFGLASYMAETRRREIGIRKVLGASVAGIAGLMAGDFVKLVLVSVLVATPIAWYAMNHWLQTFSYRVQIGVWIFLAAGGLAILIALATVSCQAVRAALSNPVKSLRTE
ncbi:MAG TPA: ABC transporter permease [Puia sp.]|nr:ABC transporter permease [Puia sp.]